MNSEYWLMLVGILAVLGFFSVMAITGHQYKMKKLELSYNCQLVEKANEH